MLIILSLLIGGILIGYALRNRQLFKGLDSSISYTIYLMLFILGASIGTNREVLTNLSTFGVQALLIAVLSITGSVCASWFALKIFLKNRSKDER